MKGTLLAALTLATIISGTLGMTTFTPFHVSVMTVIIIHCYRCSQ